MARRGRYAKGVVKRDEILDAALAAFAERGYDRTSVREIARAVGLSQAGLLHYFANKEELFAEVLRRRDERNERQYDQNRGNPVSADGLVEIVRHNVEEPGLVRLFVALSAESTAENSPARSFFTERYRAIRGGIAADIRERQARGDLADDLDADAVASLLVAAADGLQIQWLLEPETVDMGARLEQMLQALQRVGPRVLDGDPDPTR
ncbi:MAG: helix-turn-helix domain-containing protein [Actinomycetota bacterium]|nr:helix-turn-helix domain-containing protein [Actinomycetota bacterium]